MPSNQPRTIRAMLQASACGHPNAPALLAEGRPPLSYRSLAEHVDTTAAALRACGIGRNDRVGIVLPNGPEMAAAFLSVASCATADPLNPAYQAQEYKFYLADLGARALLVEAGSTSPAVAVAGELGIPILELIPAPDGPAGQFSIVSEQTASPNADGSAEPEDTALMLHTSGTT